VPVVLNLGGEGEVPDAIDVNSLGAPRRGPETFVRPGAFIRADFRALPIRPDSVDAIVGRHIPLFFHDRDDVAVAREAYTVLVRGGTVRLLPTVPANRLLPSLAAAGFANVRLEGGFAVGEKLP
jgi:hypothetical protein